VITKIGLHLPKSSLKNLWRLIDPRGIYM